MEHQCRMALLVAVRLGVAWVIVALLMVDTNKKACLDFISFFIVLLQLL